jgi:hypothetical protein
VPVTGRALGPSPVILAAIAGWLVMVACVVTGVALRVLDPVPMIENAFQLETLGLIAVAILAATWVSTGSLLMIRRPDHVVGRWVLIVGMGHAVSVLAAATASSALALGAEGADVARWSGWLAGLATLLGSGVFYLALIYPTGRGQTRAWDRVARLVLACIALTIAAVVLQPGPLHLFPGLTNPLGVGPSLILLLGERQSPAVVVLGIVAFAPVVVASMVSRYRSAGPVERAQLRWFVAAVGLTLTSLAIIGVASVNRIALGQAPLIAFGLAGSTVPIAIGIAILRYRLYEIDRIVSRTIGWVAVTTIVGAIFVLAVVGLQAVLSRFTEGNTLAVAGSTLVVAALFQPLRIRVQRSVDRRFHRARYDGERTVQALGSRLRDEVDLVRIRRAVVSTADEAVQPVAAAMWLRGAAE